MRMRAGAITGALCLWLLTGGAGSQQPGTFPNDPLGVGPASGPSMPSPPRGGPNSKTPFPSVQDTIPNPNEKPSDRQIAAMNGLRQKQIVTDTDKLLSLALQLKADVDKSSKDTLSLDVIRKADEIEKLAHSVKEKMRQ